MSPLKAQTISFRISRKTHHRWWRHQFRNSTRNNTWIVETILAMVAMDLAEANTRMDIIIGTRIPARTEAAPLPRIQIRPTLASAKAPRSITTRITIAVDTDITGGITTTTIIIIMAIIAERHPVEMPQPPTELLLLLLRQARRT